MSLLYYFGMLTVSGTYKGKTKLIIPNQVVREQLYTYLLNTYNEADLSFNNHEKMSYPLLWLTMAHGNLTSTTLPIV